MKAFWAFDKAAFEPSWCPLVVHIECQRLARWFGTPFAKAASLNAPETVHRSLFSLVDI